MRDLRVLLIAVRRSSWRARFYAWGEFAMFSGPILYLEPHVLPLGPFRLDRII